VHHAQPPKWEPVTAARAVGDWRGAAGGVFAVAWGANQFVSLLVAYREYRGISTAVNDGLFGIYAVGLVVALLLGGPAADSWGRARLMRPAVIVSLGATVLLMAGSDHLALLFAGRFVAGAASGVVLAAGTAWVKELSVSPFDRGATDEAGARRGAIALSLGFGLGPLVTGLVAQWAPAPLVTAYVPHLVLVVAVLPAVWRAPETLRAVGARSAGFGRRMRVPSAAHPRFGGWLPRPRCGSSPAPRSHSRCSRRWSVPRRAGTARSSPGWSPVSPWAWGSRPSSLLGGLIVRGASAVRRSVSSPRPPACSLPRWRHGWIVPAW